MSATNRGTIRDSRDHYKTPEWVTKAIIRALPACPMIVDAGCGTGAIAKALLEHIPPDDIASGNVTILGLELDEGLASEAKALSRPGVVIEQGDFFAERRYQHPTLVISNPPFSLAEEFVSHAISITEDREGSIAMLLRLNFLASKKRSDLFKRWKPDVYVLSKRPSFTADGHTDATEYAWFLSGPKRGGRWFRIDAEEK